MYVYYKYTLLHCYALLYVVYIINETTYVSTYFYNSKKLNVLVLNVDDELRRFNIMLILYNLVDIFIKINGPDDLLII